MDAIRKEHWRDFTEEGDDKKNIRSLRWEVYVKYKEDFIEREFWVSYSNPKGGVLFGLA